jgi:hypothetical protein
MTPAEQFAAWRAEIAGELAVAQEQIAAVRIKLSTAEAAHAEVRAAWTALNEFAAGAVRGGEGIAGPLHSRLSLARETLTAAEGERGAGRASVEALTQRLARLQESLDQIDRACGTAKVSTLRPPPEPSRRRTAPPVEFDNIQLPAATRGASQ